MTRAGRMHDQEYEGIIDVPYEVRVFLSSTASNIIDGFRNQLRTHEPTVDFQVTGSTREAMKEAVMMQRWGYSALRREREQSMVDPNLQCGGDLLLRGATCKKIVVDVDRIMSEAPKRGSKSYQDWETQAMTNWPFVSRTIDPLSVFPSPGQNKPLSFMLERQIRAASEMWERYPEWKDPQRGKKQGRNPARRVEWLEYWTPEFYVVEADGELVFERPNPYGLVPYIFEWSGMGRAHADGDPSHLAIGIITKVLGELEEEVRLKTAISVQTQMHVFPPILTVEDPRRVARQFGVGPGKVIRHQPNFPPQYMNYPPPNENMYLFLSAIQQNIARVNSPAVQGVRDPGVHYGVLQAQMVGQALTAIAPIRATLDRIGSQTLNMMASMMRVMDIPMAVTGSAEPMESTLRLKGKDFKHCNFGVTFEAVDPAENDRMLLVGEAMRRAGDISQRTFWKKYAKHIVEDPDQEEINLLAETLMAQLAASGELKQIVLSEDVQSQLAGETAQGAEEVIQNQLGGSGAGIGSAAGPNVQSVPRDVRQNARDMEQIAGTPGAGTIPAEIREQGVGGNRPTQR
jgi:hypothetical protein